MSMNLGINVVEVDGATPSIQGAPTSVAGFVIRSRRGLPGVVRQISNFTQFLDYFGGFVAEGNDDPGTPTGTQTSYVGAYAIRGFFDNGGSLAYVTRVAATEASGTGANTVTPAAAATTTFAAFLPSGAAVTPTLFTATAAFRGHPDVGAWGNSIAVGVVPNDNVINGFDLTVYLVTATGAGPTYKVLEAWTKLVIGGAPGAQKPEVINDPNTGSKYILFASRPAPRRENGRVYSVGEYAANGGNLYMVTATTGDAKSGADTDAPTGKGPGLVTDHNVTWAYVTPTNAAARTATTPYKAGDYATNAGNLYSVTATVGASNLGPTTTTPAPEKEVTWRFVQTAATLPWAYDHDYKRGDVATNDGSLYVVTSPNGKSAGMAAGGPKGKDPAKDNEITWTYVQPVTNLAWARKGYIVGEYATNDGNLYIVDATSSTSTSGPTGTGASIPEPDGKITWAHVAAVRFAASAYNTLANGAEDNLSSGDGGTLATALASAFTLPSPFDPYDIALFACPETTDPGVVKAALAYCKNRGDSMFVGHVPDKLDVPAAKDYVKTNTLQGDNVYGALYYPYLQVVDPIGSVIWIPPTGHVMGVYARTDQQRGIWKAPAGNEALVSNALDVRRKITDADHTDLVKNGSVNAIRPITGAGIVIDSSRTLSTNSLWLYVNVRLLFNFVKTSLKYGLRWVVQEPNDKTLWNKIKYNSVTPFLFGLWRRGAFGPGASADVFTIKVDGTNNSADDIKNGILNIEVYFYPSRPAETIVITVGQQEGGAKISEG